MTDMEKVSILQIHSNNEHLEELMTRIQSNQSKLTEIENTLALIETEEEGIKKRLEIFEEQLKTKFTELETMITLLF